VTRVFADTSALYALLVRSDDNHERAARAYRRLQNGEAVLVTSSYVLVESYALLGRRIGLKAVEAFRSDFTPLLETVWVDATLHERGLDLLLERKQPRISLVDAVSFLVIRDQRIDRAFAYDEDFRQEGFELAE
jgi:uncharacterized protein